MSTLSVLMKGVWRFSDLLKLNKSTIDNTSHAGGKIKLYFSHNFQVEGTILVCKNTKSDESVESCPKSKQIGDKSYLSEFVELFEKDNFLAVKYHHKARILDSINLDL